MTPGPSNRYLKSKRGSRLKIIRAKSSTLTKIDGGKEYRSKSGVIYTARQVKQRKIYEQTGQQLSLEKAAEQRRRAWLGWQTAPKESQAGKQRETATRKRIDRFLADPASTYQDYRSDKRRSLTPTMRSDFLSWRERRLGGEYLEDMSEFGPMMDVARAVNDVPLINIAKS